MVIEPRHGRSGGDAPSGPVVLQTPPPSLRARRWAYGTVGVVLCLWIAVLVAGKPHPISLLAFVYPTVMAIVLPLKLRGNRLEFGEDALVLRTRRCGEFARA